jgi:hypothetical protein
VHFGLGKHKALDSLEILWPSGKRQKFESVAARRILEIREDRDGLRRVK